MPHVSIAIIPGREPHQTTIGANAPAVAGTVEIRIGDTIGHAEARRAIEVLRNIVNTNQLKG